MKRRDYQREREEAKKQAEALRVAEQLRRAQENRAARRLADFDKRVRKLRIKNHFGMEYYAFEKGRITSEKVTGVWHHEGNTVFIRCLGCLTIIKIDWDDIEADGYTSNCIICPSGGCHMHQYIYFKGFWDKEVPKK